MGLREFFNAALMVRVSIAALLLLGLAELIVIDISANFIRISSLAGSGLFFVASSFILLFSAAIAMWAVLKLGIDYSNRLASGICSGALVGFCSSFLICIFVFFVGMFGRGIERLMPLSIESAGTNERTIAYAAACVLIILAYSVISALLGAVVSFFSKKPKSKTKAQVKKEIEAEEKGEEQAKKPKRKKKKKIASK